MWSYTLAVRLPDITLCDFYTLGVLLKPHTLVFNTNDLNKIITTGMENILVKMMEAFLGRTGFRTMCCCYMYKQHYLAALFISNFMDCGSYKDNFHSLSTSAI